MGRVSIGLAIGEPDTTLLLLLLLLLMVVVVVSGPRLVWKRRWTSISTIGVPPRPSM